MGNVYETWVKEIAENKKREAKKTVTKEFDQKRLWLNDDHELEELMNETFDEHKF
jgi:hypothetical protein